MHFEAVESESFDVILMDWQMPVMDGLEAAKRIRGAGSNVPIIALTANAMRGDQEKCLDAGCTGYLAKPVDYEALVAELQKHLRPVNPTGVNVEQQTNTSQEGEVLCPDIQ